MPILAFPSAVASLAREQDTSLRLATNNIIPLIFNNVNTGGLLFAFHHSTVGSGETAVTTVTMGVIWGWGEQEFVADVLLDSEAPVDGVQINSYRGTLEQGVDPMLAEVIPNYNDTLTAEIGNYELGLAYSVIRYTTEQYDYIPEPTASLGGMTSTNTPIEALQRIVGDSLFGAELRVDSASLDEANEFANETLIDGDKRELRTEFHGVLRDKTSNYDLIEGLAAYAMCHSFVENGTVHVEPLRDKPVTRTITEFDLTQPIHIEASPLNNLPNSFIGRFEEDELVESSVYIRSPEFAQGLEQERVSEANLTGYNAHGPAYRNLHWRYQYYRQALGYRLVGWHSLFNVQQGDILDVNAYRVRAIMLVTNTPNFNSDGTVTISAIPYSPKFFTDAIVDCPPCEMTGDIYYPTPAEIELPLRPERLNVVLVGEDFVVTIPELPDNVTYGELVHLHDGVRVTEEVTAGDFTVASRGEGEYRFQLRWVNADGYSALSLPTILFKEAVIEIADRRVLTYNDDKIVRWRSQTIIDRR